MARAACRVLSSLVLAGPILLGSLSLSAAQEHCKSIKFAKGRSSTTITGMAPGGAENMPCYQIETGAGQTAKLRLTKGRNVAFTIYDIVDAQDSYTFRTDARIYKFIVFLLDNKGLEPFKLRISVTGGR